MSFLNEERNDGIPLPHPAQPVRATWLAGRAQCRPALYRRSSPLPEAVQLADAPFWKPSQAAFLREEILEDGDWAEVVDDLNARLHS
jgi:hypothetical protein